MVDMGIGGERGKNIVPSSNGKMTFFWPLFVGRVYVTFTKQKHRPAFLLLVLLVLPCPTPTFHQISEQQQRKLRRRRRQRRRETTETETFSSLITLDLVPPNVNHCSQERRTSKYRIWCGCWADGFNSVVHCSWCVWYCCKHSGSDAVWAYPKEKRRIRLDNWIMLLSPLRCSMCALWFGYLDIVVVMVVVTMICGM